MLNRMLNPQPKNKHDRKRNESLPILPYDLIVDILSRLPVKSLLRFKSVSKFWLTLFTDSCFVKMHLSRSQKRRLVFSCRTVSSLASSRLVVFSIVNDQTQPIIHIDSPLPSRCHDNSISFSGSCDGLILCVTSPLLTLLLLNTSTREQIRLQDSPFKNSAPVSYGFGYDSSTDDYKIVEISSYSYDANTTTVCIYALKANSWRRIQDSPFSMVSRDPGTLLNGVLHWWSKSNMSKIVAFNIAEEKFHEFLLPSFEPPSKLRFIGALRGCLCITLSLCTNVPDIIYSTDENSELWVMMEYGKRESWTKFATSPYELVKPLDFTNNDEIQFLMDSSLLSYNLRNNAHRFVQIPFTYTCHEILQYGEAEVCVESIVSSNHHRCLI